MPRPGPRPRHVALFDPATAEQPIRLRVPKEQRDEGPQLTLFSCDAIPGRCPSHRTREVKRSHTRATTFTACIRQSTTWFFPASDATMPPPHQHLPDLVGP